MARFFYSSLYLLDGRIDCPPIYTAHNIVKPVATSIGANVVHSDNIRNITKERKNAINLLE